MPDTPDIESAPEQVSSSRPATVTDRRTTPPGVLPRGVQTWLLAGVAAFMLVIMLVVGRPSAPPRATPAPAPAPAQTADRVRDYQDRLRSLDAQALLNAPDGSPAVTAPVHDDERAQPAPDPIAADRKRREYESLFASNVVLSRRPENERPGPARPAAADGRAEAMQVASPSVDEIAEAVLRATARVNQPNPVTTPNTVTSPPPAVPGGRSGAASDKATVAEQIEPISAAGPLHRILEGTVIDAVLTNRLDGSTAAPVNCLVTNALYSHSGLNVLIPAGARLLGETRPVQTFGEARLAVSFHRLLMPDGRTYRLDRFLGLNQIGDAGLRDRVNQHYLSTFGAAAAVGLISGLSQFLGGAGLGGGDGDRTVVIAGGVGDATSQATLQVMNRFLNRLPTITIREGHRVKVYLTSDLDLPAYVVPASTGPF
jgi:type IV secretion system protein TrbI